MDTERSNLIMAARRDFSRARLQAFWESVWGSITGKSKDLLKFEDVQEQLKLQGQRMLGLQNIPLNKIVGTVGRYNDFTRSFLPRKTVDQDRWQRLNALARGIQGFPPIEVYKVGDVYFVLDGNHRVSVAHSLGQPTIEAYVTEIPTSVPFDENVTPEELTVKAGYADFLRRTRLDVLRPDSNVILTEPGMYQQIIQHIEVHRYFMGIDLDRPVMWNEAVESWYDNVYQPMVEAIRQYDLLREFGNRTEADLYVWLIRHQAILTDLYGGTVLTPEETTKDFIQRLD